MILPPFDIGRLPRIHFGAGVCRQLPELVASHLRTAAGGDRVLLVRGRQALDANPAGSRLLRALTDAGLALVPCVVSGEPTPEFIDEAVTAHRDRGIGLVLGVGGGSVLDAAKAIAGLLVPGNSILDHLEGVGPERPYTGPALPFIAVPTTAGTGSEATRNAVISRSGAWKKSFRSEHLVASHAFVDPDLFAGCPRPQAAANGMDALTQLLEAWVSRGASPFTDALAIAGLEMLRDNLDAWLDHDDPAARGAMACAALYSGICLAHAGLGAVHGIAAPLGALFPVPHGVACGTLLAETTAANISALEERDAHAPALARYARLGRLLRQRHHMDDDGARVFLVHRLRELAEGLDMPRLSRFGVGPGDIATITAGSRGNSMRSNPVELTDAEISAILAARL